MPPSPAPQSNVRAFINLKETTIYAGEEVQCIITFRNIARPAAGGRREEDALFLNGNNKDPNRRPSHAPASLSRRSSMGTHKPALSRATSASSVRGVAAPRGHRPSLSINVVSASTRGAPSGAGAPNSAAPASAVRAPKGHGRSLSIMSLGSEPVVDTRTPTTPGGSKRPLKAHARSASLQHLPRLNAPGNNNSTMQPPNPSPLNESTTPPAQVEPSSQPLPIRPGRRRTGTASAGNTPTISNPAGFHKKSNTETDPNNFKFPASQSPDKAKPPRSASTMHSSQSRPYSPRPTEPWSSGVSNLKALSRVMSESSVGGTPRTSSEFYSQSNNSDETLTSEIYNPSQAGRLSRNVSHTRRASRSPQSFASAEPETLMMAYVQTTGQFTLDGSLVNAAPFEEVKRRGVQGGGGVVGVEKSKRSSGMFGAFSWGNLGESLGGLLGSDELSSIAKMKASARSKSIPLLSTPQSLLFIDLQLAPGESKSYSYRFRLPFGLPPSYRGRAIKMAYHVVLGVQRPESTSVVHVEVPFRVLGSYDSSGDLLSYDLMSPQILLQDRATTSVVSAGPLTPASVMALQNKTDARKAQSPKQGLEDFLRYTERLLKDANGAIMTPFSPTSPAISRQPSMIDQQPINIKEAIDLAILRSNYAGRSGKTRQSDVQVANRFNIARSGQPVAVLTILRPAYKLGETVTGIIDFTAPSQAAELPPQAPSYSVLVELESAEQIDASLALRSNTSVNRVTRKVYASMRENALFARQLTFNLAIPSTAAPSFDTTGVSLVWQLKIEFTTQRPTQGLGLEGVPIQEEDLLEEMSGDERGTTFVARDRLLADTFEIAVPIKVYGTIGIDYFNNADELLV